MPEQLNMLKILGVVHHLLGWEEREVWKVWYKGVPRVCYRCLQHGHILRDCKSAPVNLMSLGSGSGIGEQEPLTGAEGSQVEAGQGGKPRTFAQVLKEDSFTADLKKKIADEAAAKKVREEKVANEQAAKQEREKEKQVREEERRKKEEERRRMIAEKEEERRS